MKERPILMSGAMVRATLHDVYPKTQTRRVVKPQPWETAISAHYRPSCPSGSGGAHPASVIFSERETLEPPWAAPAPVVCPFGESGDRLWVRESLAATRDAHGYIVDWHYAADGARVPRMPGLNPDFNDAMAFAHLARKAVPSIHMPRWASRITLEVTGVRVERLHDISGPDCIAEGIERYTGPLRWVRYLDAVTGEPSHNSAREAYFALWEHLNGAGSVEANPWVWVIEFKRVTP